VIVIVLVILFLVGVIKREPSKAAVSVDALDR
jgi:hypothetical protein